MLNGSLRTNCYLELQMRDACTIKSKHKVPSEKTAGIALWIWERVPKCYFIIVTKRLMTCVFRGVQFIKYQMEISSLYVWR